MNPVPLFLIIVSLPLLLGGCGEEGGPIKKSVNKEEIEFRGQVVYLKGSDAPYTGKIFGLLDGRNFEFHTNDGKIDGPWVTWHQNGQKLVEANYKNGKQNGLETAWHENGQKASESNWKDGEVVKGSAKFWNSKGEPVDSKEEAKAE